MKYSILFFATLLLFSCSDDDSGNIIDKFTKKGGYVVFQDSPSILHDIAGDNTTVIDATLVDENKNANSYSITILKDDGTLTDVLSTVNSFPGKLVVNRQQVMDALGVATASDLPANVTFIGIVETDEGTYNGLPPSFNTSTNEQTGGNTNASLLAVAPNPMNFTMVMFQLVSPNTATSFFVSSSSDDVEEILALNGQDGPVGEMDLTSSDLEFGELSGGQGLMGVGLRFNYVGLPSDATITSAKLQFTVDNTGSNPVTLLIYGEQSGSPSAFDNSSGNLSKRKFTSASALWDIPAWPTDEVRGSDQQTIDFSEVLQEIINQSDWVPGNSINLFLIPTGESINVTSTSGGREAVTYDADSANAAELILSYSN